MGVFFECLWLIKTPRLVCSMHWMRLYFVNIAFGLRSSKYVRYIVRLLPRLLQTSGLRSKIVMGPPTLSNINSDSFPAIQALKIARGWDFDLDFGICTYLTRFVGWVRIAEPDCGKLSSTIVTSNVVVAVV